MNKHRPDLDDGPTNQKDKDRRRTIFISFFFHVSGSISASANDEMTTKLSPFPVSVEPGPTHFVDWVSSFLTSVHFTSWTQDSYGKCSRVTQEMNQRLPGLNEVPNNCCIEELSSFFTVRNTYQQVLTKIWGLIYRLSRFRQKPGPIHDVDEISSFLNSWAQDPSFWQVLNTLRNKKRHPRFRRIFETSTFLFIFIPGL